MINLPRQITAALRQFANLASACLQGLVIPLACGPRLFRLSDGFRERACVFPRHDDSLVEFDEGVEIVAFEEGGDLLARLFRDRLLNPLSASRPSPLRAQRCRDAVRQRHEPLALPAKEPDDRGEIGELFRAEVENLNVDRAKAIITAMESIEKDYTSLAGTLPKAEYTGLARGPY